MPDLSLLGWMFVAWGIVTVSLVLLLIYRSVIGMKEDDQLFLDAAESHFEKEQQKVLAKLQWIGSYAKRLGYVSGGLILGMLGVLIYRVSS